MGYLLIQCIAYQMHCLSNALLIKCIAYQMHCLLNALLIKCVGYSMVVKHCRRTHPFSLSLSIHRHLAYLPPARPTHTPPPHQARRPSHSSPALLSGCVRVCGREGGRVLGHAMHWPWNAAAIQRIGHTGAPAPLARLRTLRLLDRERRPGLQAHGRACICTTRHHRTLPPTTAVASVYAQHAHHHNPRPRPKPLAADASESPDGSAVASAAARASWACVSAGAAPPVRVSSWRAARLGVPDSLPSFCALYVEPG